MRFLTVAYSPGEASLGISTSISVTAYGIMQPMWGRLLTRWSNMKAVGLYLGFLKTVQDSLKEKFCPKDETLAIFFGSNQGRPGLQCWSKVSHI